MQRVLFVLGALFLAVVSVFTQSPAPPKFDVASVQVSTRPFGFGGMTGGVLRGTRYELRNATMLDLIRTAYNVPPQRVTGGPSWLEWDRYNVAALAPEGTAPAMLRDMLKALLADRFGLTVHDATTTTPGFALKVGAATPKLRQSTAASNCQGQPKPNANGIPIQTITCTGMTMAMVADQLPRVAGAYFPGGAQAVDETGLTGAWDFELSWMPRALLAQAGPDAISLEQGLEAIGLKLEPRDLKVPAIVVDTVNETFTPDAPDVAKRMPASPPPEFEVAEVKPSPPDAR
jgi:uncharacterized protein (TIGR03435 family)